MNYTTILLFTGVLLNASPREPWPAGLVGKDRPERLQRLIDDIAKADITVQVRGDDQLDIGISAAHVFRLDELRSFYTKQRHKDFVVIKYIKSPDNKKIGESWVLLKEFFVEAGFKRILITLPHETGVMILGDFRVQRGDQTELPAINFEPSPPEDDDQDITLGPNASQMFRQTINSKVAEFDPKFLQKSSPMGTFFVEGSGKYEFHVDLIVRRTETDIKIWNSKFTEELTQQILKDDGSWIAFLKK